MVDQKFPNAIAPLGGQSGLHQAVGKSRTGLSGKSPNSKLMEITELPPSAHPFFLGSQFHPELKSKPLDPHPLFVEFIKAGIRNRKNKQKKAPVTRSFFNIL